nr:protein-glutamate O-methyltransferase CheR [Bacteriovorax sp. HI3]
MSSAVKVTLREGGPSLSLSDSDFNYFSEAIFKRTGIYLSPVKIDLVKTRLRKRLQARALSNYSEYRELLENLDNNDPEWQSFVNMLTTNKTFFFREAGHFDFLIEQVIPEWLKKNEETFRLWCAASSTGEEVYSLGLVLKKHLPPDRKFFILGSDVDTKVLSVAENAVYPLVEREGIPEIYHEWLTVGTKEAAGWFRIRPELRESISFKQINLVNPAMDEEPFDVVFCRNVLIYFQTDTIGKVNELLYKNIRPGGHCFLGHSESFQNISHKWKNAGISVYKK